MKQSKTIKYHRLHLIITATTSEILEAIKRLDYQDNPLKIFINIYIQ